MLFLKRWCLVTAIIFFLSIINLYAQERPRIAIIPLNPISVSKADAAALTGLLETSLVNTEVFGVIEQSQVKVILEAQEYILYDCTDESCAIEFGKLLAAEQIILGSVSRIGGKYVVNAKIIDVETGMNIKADMVEVDSLEGLTEAVELLAFKLAGLTFKRGGEEEIAKVFSELFVETEPEGAEVYVNGVKKGTSPVLIDKVPRGTVLLEARMGDMYATDEVDVRSEGLVEVKLILEISFGRIFIKSSKKDVEVYLEGQHLGSLGSGLFKDITAGEHELILKGEGLFWEGRVKVTPDQTSRVKAYPREVGKIVCSGLPEGTKVEISGKSYRNILKGKGFFNKILFENVPVGTYEVEIIGDKYKPESMIVEVNRAETAIIETEYANDYKTKLKREEKEKELTSLMALKVDFEKAYEDSLITKKRRITGGLFTGGGAIAAVATALVFLNLRNNAVTKANNSLTDPTFEYPYREIDKWDRRIAATSITGGLLGLTSIVLFSVRGNPEKIRNEIIRVELKIDSIRKVQ